MTTPEDPFAAPTGEPTAPPAYGAPPPPAYGTPPAYGEMPYGAPSGSSTDYASWGTRVVATLIDVAIIIVVQIIIGMFSSGLAQLAAFGVEIYFAYLVGTKGQSPGKQVMKIKVIKDADGSFLGAGMGIVRYFAHIADVLSLGIGFLWPLWDKKNQTFADKIVGSVVVKA